MGKLSLAALAAASGFGTPAPQAEPLATPPGQVGARGPEGAKGDKLALYKYNLSACVSFFGRGSTQIFADFVDQSTGQTPPWVLMLERERRIW